jgi:Immunity protein 22
MAKVHVFIASGRFRSFEEMRRFIDGSYSEDGEAIVSPFIREVELTGYEPMCIKAIHSERPVPLPELLANASFSSEWLPQFGNSRLADSAICVFEPNRVGHPRSSSLDYCGAFEYNP